MRGLAVILATAIFIGGYEICEISYPLNHIDPMHLNMAWNLRMILISVYTSILMIAPTLSCKNEKFTGLICFVCFSIAIQDVADKLSGDNEFHWYDLLWIMAGIFCGILKYYPEKLCLKTK